MNLSRILFVALLLSAINCFAQETKWTRIEFEKNAFSVSLPSDMIVDAEKYDKDHKLRIWSVLGETQINLVVSEPNENPKESIRRFGFNGAKETDQSEIDKVYARKILYDTNNTFPSMICVATKKYLYLFAFSSKLNGSVDIAHFLNSIKISGKIVFATDKVLPDEAEKVVADTELKSSPEVLTALNRVPNNLKAKYETERVSMSIEEIWKPPQMTRMPIFLRKPVFNLNKLKGKPVLVRIKLLANGDTGEVTAFSADADDKTISAVVDAVRTIKFVPAQLNGKNVDSYYVQEFAKFYVIRTIIVR
jgi:hypothetical protein